MSLDDIAVFAKPLSTDPMLAKIRIKNLGADLLRAYDFYVLDGYDPAEAAVSGANDLTDVSEVLLDLVGTDNPNIRTFASKVLTEPETFGMKNRLPLLYEARRAFTRAYDGNLAEGLDPDKCLLGTYKLLVEMIRQKIQ